MESTIAAQIVLARLTTESLTLKNGMLWQRNTEMKTAHYFKSKSVQYVVISESMAPIGERIAVTGKRDARLVAAKHNAQPWNF